MDNLSFFHCWVTNSKLKNEKLHWDDFLFFTFELLTRSWKNKKNHFKLVIQKMKKEDLDSEL